MYTTYIVFSQIINKYYTGQTKDLSQRLIEHNRGKTKYMATGAPWELMYFKEHNSRGEAMKLEKFIKKRGAGRFLHDKEQVG